MEDLDLIRLVAAVSERLRAAEGIAVFAVWLDGEVTREGLGFRRRISAGSWEEPVATFVSGARLSPEKIRSRIERGLKQAFE